MAVANSDVSFSSSSVFPVLYTMWAVFGLCYDEGVSHSSSITCTRYELRVVNGSPIEPVDCEDDNSPHIPLLADSLPVGIQFNGKTFSGIPNDMDGRQGVIVYNGDSAVLVVFICNPHKV